MLISEEEPNTFREAQKVVVSRKAMEEQEEIENNEVSHLVGFSDNDYARDCHD